MGALPIKFDAATPNVQATLSVSFRLILLVDSMSTQSIVGGRPARLRHVRPRVASIQ